MHFIAIVIRIKSLRFVQLLLAANRRKLEKLEKLEQLRTIAKHCNHIMALSRHSQKLHTYANVASLNVVALCAASTCHIVTSAGKKG